MHEIPEVHADPKMDPNCDSDQDVGEVDDKKQGPLHGLENIELDLYKRSISLFFIHTEKSIILTIAGDICR